MKIVTKNNKYNLTVAQRGQEMPFTFDRPFRRGKEGFHKDIKKYIIKHLNKDKDLSKELSKKNINNPDIGVDKSGNIILRHPKTKVDIKTDVKLDSFKVD